MNLKETNIHMMIIYFFLPKYVKKSYKLATNKLLELNAVSNSAQCTGAKGVP